MKKLLIGAALAAMACAASAQGYAGAVAGLARFDVDCEGASCNKGDTGLKVYGGYEVTPGIAIEAGYMNFGEFTGSDGFTSLKLKSKAFFVGGAFRSEFANTSWAGVLRAGLASVKTDASAALGGASGSRSDSNVAGYLGLGVEYKCSDSFRGVASWDFTKFEVGDEDGTVHLFGVGVQGQF